MNDEPHLGASEEDLKVHLRISDLPSDEGGMTMSRMEEIEEADERGEPLDITAEERREYAEGKAELAEVMKSFQRVMRNPFEGINKQLGKIVADSFRPAIDIGSSFRLSRSPQTGSLPQTQPPIKANGLVPPPIARRSPSYDSPSPAVTNEQLKSVGDAVRERDTRQAAIQDNTFEMAIAMKKMLDQMEASGETETKRWWLVFGVAILSMVLAGIAAGPVLIDFWRFVTVS